MRKNSIGAVVAAALLAIGVAGCGDDNADTAKPATSAEPDKQQQGKVLALAADPDGALKYDKTSLEAPAGNVTIELTNKSSVTHDVEVEDSDERSLGKSDEITDSETSLNLQNVAAGKYTYYCTLPGHEQAGMKGALTVTE